MSKQRPFRIFVANACAAALLCGAASASAQLAVYRHVDGAGQAVFTDQAEPPQPSPMQTTPESDAVPPPAKKAALPSRRSALVNANEAKRRLAQTELKRKQGMAPLPGESVQGPGGTAMNYRYWRRQEKLRIDVEQAQRRANAVQRPLLATQ